MQLRHNPIINYIGLWRNNLTINIRLSVQLLIVFVPYQF